MPKYIKSAIYEIFYDYCDYAGNEERNIKETFEGTWAELREYIEQMRRDGCYNIDATYIEGFGGYSNEDEQDEWVVRSSKTIGNRKSKYVKASPDALGFMTDDEIETHIKERDDAWEDAKNQVLELSEIIHRGRYGNRVDYIEDTDYDFEYDPNECKFRVYSGGLTEDGLIERLRELGFKEYPTGNLDFDFRKKYNTQSLHGEFKISYYSDGGYIVTYKPL